VPGDFSDIALLERAGRGDETAFVLLYERHRDVLFRFSWRMLGQVETAEDVTHDCFVGLLAHPERYEPSRASLRRTFVPLRAIKC
jgi:RNA polymerase sigma-70 factor (ECF subfamily)